MGALKIGRTVMTQCATNCYFIYREGGSDALVVDPGDHGTALNDKLTEMGFQVKAILLTHGHFDHIGGVNALKKVSGATVYALDEEKTVLENPELSMMLQYGDGSCVYPDVYLKDNEEVTIGDISFTVIHTPGHTVGSSCFYFEEDGVLISGDTLFSESVGRSDFPTGSTSELLRSIKDRLFTLPPGTIVYPGHGERTTIEHEMMYNPFCGSEA